jgi:uncharacterized lipoprotein YajG
MRARATSVGVLLAAVLFAAGCGAKNSTDMDVKFQKLDYEMATLETVNSSYNIDDFEKETQKYIALVRAYAHQLGRAEARRRLTEKGEELSGYCLPCVATLETEATKY